MYCRKPWLPDSEGGYGRRLPRQPCRPALPRCWRAHVLMRLATCFMRATCSRCTLLQTLLALQARMSHNSINMYTQMIWWWRGHRTNRGVCMENCSADRPAANLSQWSSAAAHRNTAKSVVAAFPSMSAEPQARQWARRDDATSIVCVPDDEHSLLGQHIGGHDLLGRRGHKQTPMRGHAYRCTKRRSCP